MIDVPGRDALVITATRRLQRQILQNSAEHQRRQKRQAWPTPRVVTWTDWLGQSWRQLRNQEPDLELPLLLQPAQELGLWEQHIRAGAQQELLNLHATARSAAGTWQLLHDYDLDLEDVHGTDEDSSVWRSWAQTFANQCRQQSWLTQAELCARLCDAIGEHWWRPTRHLRFLGFHSPTPVQREMWKALEEHGCDVELESGTPRPGSLVQTGCQDPLDELHCAARWARELLQRGERGPIGVIVQDFGALRDEAAAVFRAVLQPQDLLAPPTQELFHISMGRPLADHPLVADALRLLRWSQQPITAATLARVLQSPYVRGAETEMVARAELDARLRLRGWREIGVAGLLNHLRYRQRCPELIACLEQAAKLKPGATRLSPGQWIEFFTQWLNSFGWPGNLVLGSAEYQTFATWRELLSRFAATGLVLPEVDAEQAVGRLTHMARQQIYQPLLDPAPIQVMGPAEAAGLQFDHLWLAGMSEDQWPPPPQPDPFLPVALQRQAGMPNASAELALQQAQTITKVLRNAASEIVVSFPRQKLEQQLSISPLFADAAPQRPALNPFSGAARWLAAQSAPFENLRDDKGPSIDDPAMRGGAGLFQDQALCPFRGFAKRRLFADRLPEIDPGISPAEHGELVHKCLAQLWRRWGQQSVLSALTSEQRATQLEDTVNEVIGSQPRSQDRFSAALWRLQKQRLLDLLTEWLELDSSRAPFTVRATEDKVSAQFGGVQVDLKLDRIDETSTGALVMDYKTGMEVSTRRWFDPRPEQPQLPLYALAASQPVQGIAFAWVRRGGCKITGISGDDMDIAGINALPDGANAWAQQLDDWRASLQALGQEIRSGWAAVAPKHSSVCLTCDVHPLCRIFEASAGDEGSDDG